MSDTPVYIVANLVTHDKEEYLKYEKGFFPLLKKHGGTFITFDDNIKHMEGTEPRPGRIIIFQFPSEAVAEAWYNDPEYQDEVSTMKSELERLRVKYGDNTVTGMKSQEWRDKYRVTK